MPEWKIAKRDHWSQEWCLSDGDLSLNAGIYRRAGIPVHSIKMYNRGELVAMIALDTVGNGILNVHGALVEHNDEIRGYLEREGLTPVARRYFNALLGRIG